MQMEHRCSLVGPTLFHKPNLPRGHMTPVVTQDPFELLPPVLFHLVFYSAARECRWAHGTTLHSYRCYSVERLLSSCSLMACSRCSRLDQASSILPLSYRDPILGVLLLYLNFFQINLLLNPYSILLYYDW